MKVERKKVELLMVRNSIDSQKQLSEESGVSQQTICCILKGRNCKPVIARKISAALKCDVEEIVST